MVDEEAERKASEAAVRAESKRRKEEDAQRRARMLAEAMEGKGGGKFRRKRAREDDA
jgi:hypothetical protein